MLRQNYPWLSEAQLRAALGYYEIYPSEINARLEREARCRRPKESGGSFPSRGLVTTEDSMRFLLDEDLNPATAEIARGLGPSMCSPSTRSTGVDFKMKTSSVSRPPSSGSSLPGTGTTS